MEQNKLEAMGTNTKLVADGKYTESGGKDTTFSGRLFPLIYKITYQMGNFRDVKLLSEETCHDWDVAALAKLRNS